MSQPKSQANRSELLVRDAKGEYRLASGDEVLKAARRRAHEFLRWEDLLIVVHEERQSKPATYCCRPIAVRRSLRSGHSLDPAVAGKVQ